MKKTRLYSPLAIVLTALLLSSCTQDEDSSRLALFTSASVIIFGISIRNQTVCDIHRKHLWKRDLSKDRLQYSFWLSVLFRLAAYEDNQRKNLCTYISASDRLKVCGSVLVTVCLSLSLTHRTIQSHRQKSSITLCSFLASCIVCFGNCLCGSAIEDFQVCCLAYCG